MTSYNDYIASKRLYTVNNIPSNCNTACILSPGPLYDGSAKCGAGNCEMIVGPTGPPGDKYLSYFTETFYQNILINNGVIGIVVDKQLSYLPGMKVKCQIVLLPTENDNKCFYGVVSKYDTLNGALIISNINNITANFPFGIQKQYSVNVDNTGPPVALQPTANQIDITLDPPETYIFSLSNNTIIGNSITFSNANASKTISYNNIGTTNGFVINDNVEIDTLYLKNSGTNNISHNGSTFLLNGNTDISGNINIYGNAILGNISDDINYNSVFAKLPQLATSLNSFVVRMALTNISGIFKWQLFASTSSKNYKKNIETLPDSTDILNVRPVTYNPLSAINGEMQETHIGFIAEEMAENELGSKFVIRDENGIPKSIQYDLMIPVYASAMRNINTRLKELEQKVELLSATKT